MKLAAYRLEPFANIRPASTRRAWMDAWPDKHAYHCLPLTVTNGYGWEMACGSAFTATWNGGDSKQAITIVSEGQRVDPMGHSHFGRGILTFFTGCILRTDQPYHLFVTGPINSPKHGLSPLSAIVETSWLPYTFAMSFVFTQPGIPVRFEAGEPFCQFFPLDSRSIETCDAEWLDLESDPDFWRQVQEYRLARRLGGGMLPDFDDGRGYHHFYQRGIGPNGDALTPRPPTRYLVPRFARPSEVGVQTAQPSSDNGIE